MEAVWMKGSDDLEGKKGRKEREREFARMKEKIKEGNKER